MNFIKSRLILILLTYVFFVSCGDDDNGITTPLKSSKQMTSFRFLMSDNALLAETIVATIDESSKTILATIPYRTDVSSLRPTIEISEGATVSPNGAQNFSDPVQFTVTAEDGSTAVYTATVEQLVSQRDALISIFSANPGNTLGWDIMDNDISTWSGVSLNDDGKVSSLNILDKNLTVIPEEIGVLTGLTFLELRNNRLTTLPEEIGELTVLAYLGLNNNTLTSIPDEIGQLTGLTKLFMFNNNLSAIPGQITSLTNLTQLTMGANDLTSIPDGIGQLIELTWLNLYSNELTTIPASVGLLINLETLDLMENNLTTIPQAICDLATSHGTAVNVDAGVTCVP